jgi:hypothetical protein
MCTVIVPVHLNRRPRHAAVLPRPMFVQPVTAEDWRVVCEMGGYEA